MYNIFFGSRRVAVCSNPELPASDPDAVLYSPGSFPDLANLPHLFFQTTGINTLYIPTLNEESAFRQLCTSLNKINAGGGLVTNKKGEVLVIFRYGKWDLPKGTQEPAEDIRYSAIREVSEECGLDMGSLEIKEHICDTYHAFARDNRHNLKYTKWYRMEFSGDDLNTIPQASENIEQALWVEPAGLDSYLSNTYPSIKEVFKRSGFKFTGMKGR
ncbi:MAG: NUDIX domain-containing protein [Bacteroidia bacterium]|nr:NUDIX domain-containing protein [Bacteroidales bacterium]MDD3300397.1 NUDIX domain-containing protein [Bacteroidales bacterium]NCC46050.1 NUDIX domain-containing protein [Bacteroidia bacterium]